MSDFVNDYLAGEPQTTVMIRYMLFLRRIGFKPRVIYDVGAYNTSFANVVKEVFPDTRIILFDACKDNCEKMVGYEYYNVCLGDTNNEVDFYEVSDKVKSCYKPKTYGKNGWDRTNKVSIQKLDEVAMKYGLPFPDLIRMDCCGSERDIINGANVSLSMAKYLIINLQNEELFEGAPLAITTGPIIKSLGYGLKDVLDLYNTPLIDYVFENINI
jgi:FkbM family methyltransferase